MHANSPQALLDATIYFDFRPIYGRRNSPTSCANGCSSACPAKPCSCASWPAMPSRSSRRSASSATSPSTRSPDFPHTLDLKASGARLFVDAARILALANGVTDTGTVQRLRALAERAASWGDDDVNAVIESFFFIQQLRLKNQQGDVGEGSRQPRRSGSAQRTRPHWCCKEAFKQAKRLQSRLQLEYRL
jgi:CBS domain-containing protein